MGGEEFHSFHKPLKVIISASMKLPTATASQACAQLIFRAIDPLQDTRINSIGTHDQGGRYVSWPIEKVNSCIGGHILGIIQSKETQFRIGLTVIRN